MKINKMTGYAIRVVARMYSDSGLITTSRMIAETENIPQGVLMKVLSRLRAAGVIDSHQGRGGISGGFSLAVDVKNLSLYDIIITMEGDLSFCPYEEKDEVSEHVFNAMETYNRYLINELKGFTINDIVDTGAGVTL